jgi:hypothetical protein
MIFVRTWSGNGTQCGNIHTGSEPECQTKQKERGKNEERLKPHSIN